MYFFVSYFHKYKTIETFIQNVIYFFVLILKRGPIFFFLNYIDFLKLGIYYVYIFLEVITIF